MLGDPRTTAHILQSPYSSGSWEFCSQTIFWCKNVAQQGWQEFSKEKSVRAGLRCMLLPRAGSPAVSNILGQSPDLIQVTAELRPDT